MVAIPSSIAVYGPKTLQMPSERTVLSPTTMYGVTKTVTEHVGRYYSRQTALDVRGIRFPGIISHRTRPSGGTTDYAVDAFYQAVREGEYTYFVSGNTRLPMIYMSDAIRALIQLGDADKDDLRHNCEYNVMGVNFSATELTTAIREHIPGFDAEYETDERQEIADSWPAAIDDTAARDDWGWRPEYDLERITDDMIQTLDQKVSGSGGP